MNYDVIIIGAGTVGMAAGYFLAKKGKKVALIDASDPPHTEGSHHGETRLIRHAYGEGPHYVAMALRASELWEELENEADTKIFHNTGVLNIGTKDSAFFNMVKSTANDFSIAVETLSAKEINNRWPGFFFADNYIGVFEKASGILMSEEIIRAYRKLALKHNATLFSNTKIETLTAYDSFVEVTFEGKKITSEQILVTAGKGTNQVLAHLGLELPLTPTRKTFSWFEADENIYHPDHFPGWMYDDGEETYYGFPSIEKSGVKLGRHDGGVSVDPLTPLEEFGSYETDESETVNFLKEHFSGLGPHRVGKVCTYTMTPDEDFIIDRLPGYDNLFVAAGFSGHGFKFGSVLGEILSELLIDGTTKLDISSFSLKRFEAN
jgi:sarcosine oxidase/N-methyl-L-tryptophan oxidase